MKIKFCRSCKSNNIKKVFDLGKQKLSGVFPKNKNQDHLPSGSLSMVFCNTCKLLQLENSFDPNAMYGDNYGYMSSLNSSMLKHLYNKSCNLKKIVELSVGDAVVDIGSNDGTLLKFFKKFSCNFLLILFLTTDFLDTFLLMAIANLKDDGFKLFLCEIRTSGLDLTILKSIRRP